MNKELYDKITEMHVISKKKAKDIFFEYGDCERYRQGKNYSDAFKQVLEVMEMQEGMRIAEDE